MIPITKYPTKERIDKKILQHYLLYNIKKILKKIKQGKTVFITGDFVSLIKIGRGSPK